MEQESGRISELNYMAPHKLKKKSLFFFYIKPFRAKV